MRIRSKVALVGGIPMLIAAAITVVAWLLLDRAERAQGGAALAGAIYRDLVEVVGAHDAFVRVQPGEREAQARSFGERAESALARLRQLAETVGGPAGEEPTLTGLVAYRARMDELEAATLGNDELVALLNARTASLVALTDKARARQHASNIDIIASIGEGEGKLRLARDIVDSAQEVRGAALAYRAEKALAGGGPEAAEPVRARNRLRGAAAILVRHLTQARRLTPVAEIERLGAAVAESPDAERRFTDYVDRLIKIYATDQRALHDEVTQLLGYAVAAAETEQATQNIAIEMLVLERRTTGALASRDVGAVAGIRDDSGKLSVRVAALPISPLIQNEVVEAIDQWRAGLATAAEGLERQNRILADMATSGVVMMGTASRLSADLSRNADRIGTLVRTILVVGAGLGLLVGSVTGAVVARSILRPIGNLQARMIELAANPTGELLDEARRSDELGAMAGAANVFISEIRRREADLVRARDRADGALAELRDAQASLIQAEKLASLGQLVAGIAHEINTPVGVALTTSTALQTEVARLDEKLGSGRILRSEISRSVDRLKEGARLTFANLNRAADLVQSFKQIASDQASGERRPFVVKAWLHELLTSLGPILRRSPHPLEASCPDDLAVDGHPGALGQIVTNLITNALHHAFPEGRPGRMTLTLRSPAPGRLLLLFADDGVGIAPEHRARVFDPFYTTRRSRGSTGLGLHIVFNLVTVTLGGRIELDSTPGEGTRFTIEVPVGIAAEPAKQAERRTERQTT